MSPTRKASPRTWKIPAELDGFRVDKALARLVPEVSRTRLAEMVEDGRVKLEGDVVSRPSQALAAGEHLEVVLEERDRTRSGRRGDIELGVVFEDEHVLVVDKPAGMVAHPSGTVRGGTVSELAEERCGTLPSPQGEGRPGIVHRLDAETSGVMVLAKTEASAVELMRQFKAREVEKRYEALVHGDTRFDSDWIEKPITRSERSQGRMAIAPDGEGRESVTFYSVVDRFGDFTHLHCEPKTGRTHQIRVHLSSIGHTVVRDSLYTARRTLFVPDEAPKLARHALHAARIAFTHPATAERVAYEAPLATDMAAFLDWLRERGPLIRP